MSNPFAALSAIATAAPAADVATQAAQPAQKDSKAEKLASGDYVEVNGRMLKRTKVWLKFGMLIPTGETGEDGQPVKQFAGLPKDLPLDTMDPSSVSEAAQPLTKARVEAENWLLTSLREMGLSLEPGAHQDMPLGGDPEGVQFCVRVQRVAEKAKPTAPGENALITQMAKFFAPSA